MRPRAWLAVVPLLTVLIVLSGSVPALTGKAKDDKTKKNGQARMDDR
jgi:hypothetical protein